MVVPRNRLIQANSWKHLLKEASATVPVQEFYSYKVDVKNLSCLEFKATASWPGTWRETAWIQQSRYFGLTSWLLLQLAMQGFFRQRLVITSAVLVTKRPSLLLLVAYGHPICGLAWRWPRRSLLFPSWPALMDQLLLKLYRTLAVQVRSCLPHPQPLLALTDCLLALSNLRFLPPSWPRAVLHPCDSLAACSCLSDRLLRMFLVSWLLMLCSESETIEPFLYDLDIENPLLVGIPSNLRLLFQSSWCSWPAVTAMGNQELGMIGACRWRPNDWSPCVDSFLHRGSLLLEALQARARSLDWTIHGSRAAQSAMIAILNCIL